MFNVEVEAQGHEFDYLLEELRDNLCKITGFNATERRNRLKHSAELVQHIKTVRTAFVLELKTISDEKTRKNYEEILLEKNLAFQWLLEELNKKQHELNREQLQAEADEDEFGNNPEHATTQQITAHGDKIQNKTQESVDRIKQLALEAEEIGGATTAQLDAQTEKAGHIYEGLDNIQDSLKSARKTAQTLVKNAVKDRCIQVLCISILICLIIILVLFLIK